ncbi:MAG: restriction endonuclease subunit S [Bradyrhizobiaceae bacterium]|nr:restriction endonuclease subunit S [Bradyrhizobiaceae bacterium]
MNSNWKTLSLGEVCDLIGGGTPSKSNKSYYGGHIPWATVRDMSSDVITTTEHSITSKAVEESSTNLLPAGSVVIATRVGLGKVCMLEHDTAINQDLKGVIPKKNAPLDVRYLFWWLKSVADKIVGAGRGATVQGVKLDFVKTLQIPLPPLPEQRRIVALLDEAFAAIDQAIENTKKNIENAKELFDSYLNEVFTKKGEGWVERRLGDIANTQYGFTTKTASSQTGPKILRITDIQAGEVQWKSVPHCIIPADKLDRYSLKSGDIVFARTGATTGKSYLIKNPPPSVFASYLIRLQMKPATVLPEFVELYLQSASYWTQIQSGTTGSAQGGFNASKLSELIVTYPIDREDQLRWVDNLSAVREHCSTLQGIQLDKHALLVELKRSILQSGMQHDRQFVDY